MSVHGLPGFSPCMAVSVVVDLSQVRQNIIETGSCDKRACSPHGSQEAERHKAWKRLGTRQILQGHAPSEQVSPVWPTFHRFPQYSLNYESINGLTLDLITSPKTHL
jgi:hypothetical protein